MVLEKILVKKNYRCEKIEGQMFATPDRSGNYRATSARDVEKALTDGSQEFKVWVRRGKHSKWMLLLKVKR